MKQKEKTLIQLVLTLNKVIAIATEKQLKLETSKALKLILHN